MQVIIVGLIKI